MKHFKLSRLNEFLGIENTNLIFYLERNRNLIVDYKVNSQKNLLSY
jgi:hypothetical protein